MRYLGGRAPRAALLLLLAAFLAEAPLGAQVLEPNAVFPEDFGTLQTVTELADGRLLVADPLGQALYLVDMDAGTRTTVGQIGQGPEEYMQPDATWALPGDSILLVDLGNGRLTALGPDMGFGDTSPIGLGDPRTGLILALPQGVDDRGRIYARAMARFGQEQSDSSIVVRVTRGSTSVDSIVRFKTQDVKRIESGGANNRNVSLQQIPLSNADGWGVLGDGTVVIARSGDYHLEWHRPDGSVTRGPAIPFDAVRIGTAEKEEYVTESGRSGGGVSVQVGITNGAVQTTFSRGGGGSGPREIDQYEWPDRKPPVYNERLQIDPEGRVWVHRHVDAGDPSTYDVFNDRGERVATYAFGHGKRVLGFGESSIYVVSFDQFDLAYLERYELPTT